MQNMFISKKAFCCTNHFEFVWAMCVFKLAVQFVMRVTLKSHIFWIVQLCHLYLFALNEMQSLPRKPVEVQLFVSGGFLITTTRGSVSEKPQRVETRCWREAGLSGQQRGTRLFRLPWFRKSFRSTPLTLGSEHPVLIYLFPPLALTTFLV